MNTHSFIGKRILEFKVLQNRLVIVVHFMNEKTEGPKVKGPHGLSVRGRAGRPQAPRPSPARPKGSRRSLAGRGQAQVWEGPDSDAQALQTTDGPVERPSGRCCHCRCGFPQPFKHIKTIWLHRPNRNRTRERSGLKATLFQAMAYIT